jgi:hypothetical protein
MLIIVSALQFSIVAEPDSDKYKIAIYNDVPIVVPGWAYAAPAAGELITISPTKEFEIQRVEGVEREIY